MLKGFNDILSTQYRSWDSKSNSTTTTDSTSDASGSVTGGYISIPQLDSSLDGGLYGHEDFYQSRLYNHRYDNYDHSNHDLKAQKLLSSRGDERSRRQHYRGQLRLDVYVQHGYVTVHVIAGRNIHSKIQDPPNSYVVASIIPESPYLCHCKSSTYWNSSRPVFDEKISIEHPNHCMNRRLFITLWSHDYTFKTGDELLGCLSFGLDRKTNNGLLSSGWFYVLEGEVGRVRHVRVVEDAPQVKSYFSLYNISKVLLCRNINNGGFGFSVYGGERVMVCRVDPGSSAHHHGLHRDDMIVSIDGINVTSMPPWKVAEIIRNAGFYMNLMVKRGGDRKADVERDKFKNAIIANCIKRIMHKHGLNNKINGIMNSSDNYTGGKDSNSQRDDDDDGEVFVGGLVDYGWLDDDSAEIKKAKHRNEEKKSAYQESYEAKKFSKILKIRASNRDNSDNTNYLNNKTSLINDKLKHNFNDINGDADNLKKKNTNSNTKHKYNTKNSIDNDNYDDDHVNGEVPVGDEYLESMYSDDDDDDDGNDDSFLYLTANRNKNKRQNNKEEENNNSNDNNKTEALLSNGEETEKLSLHDYNDDDDANSRIASYDQMNEARCGIKLFNDETFENDEINVKSDNKINNKNEANDKDSKGDGQYKQKCLPKLELVNENWSNELDTIEEALEATLANGEMVKGSLKNSHRKDLRNTNAGVVGAGNISSCSGGASFDDSLVSGGSIENNLGGNDKVECNAGLEERGFLGHKGTPKTNINQLTIAAIQPVYKRPLVSCNNLKGKVNNGNEDKENVPVFSISTIPSSIKSTSSKHSKPQFFNLFRNSSRRTKPMPSIPLEGTLISSTASLPIGQSTYYNFSSSAPKTDYLENADNYQLSHRSNMNKNFNLNSNLKHNNFVNIDNSSQNVSMRDNRNALKRNGSFRNSVFVSKLKSAFKHKN